MNIWLRDPKTGDRSVSLTLLVVSFLAVLVAGGAEILEKTVSVSLFPEVFYSCVALYFGRRLNVSGKTFNSDVASDIQKQVE